MAIFFAYVGFFLYFCRKIILSNKYITSNINENGLYFKNGHLFFSTEKN